MAYATTPAPATICRRILVVEDNPIHQVVVAALLKRVGVASDVVDSGEAAVAAWETGQYDMVLMDVHLAGMDGVSATRAIREREVTRRVQHRTPVVAMTAYVTPDEVERYKDCGMTGFIGKPLDEARLLKALTLWCKPDES